MKSVMSHQFSRVPSTSIQRSQFDRSHGHKTTFDAGLLVPFFVDEVLPGDTFNCRVNGFARMATPIFPVMDNIFLDTFFFFVPYRLVWSNFKKFMGEQLNPDSSTDYLIPTISGYGAGTGELPDYMGIPVGVSQNFSVLPFRAYWLIYDEWFRDQNLQNSASIITNDASGVINNSTDYTWSLLARRGKRHDYFTSALPWPQKGDSVSIPLSGDAPVKGIGFRPANSWTGPSVSLYETGTAGTTTFATYTQGILSTDTALFEGTGTNQPAIYADLSAVSSATINQLRQSFQVQRLLEKDARGGTRYVEVIHSHFGIKNAGGDARLQRPEYLGGGTSIVNQHVVAQTSETGTTAQGNLSAFATAAFKGHGFSKSFTEHGVIIGLVNARADLTYQQGLNRMWSRQTRYDFYWPSLANLGEQAVLNKEIYATGTSIDDDVFGYQERYAEYRYKPSIVTGLFRSTAAGSLDAWHLSQQFSSLPVLNSSFIKDNPPIDRVIATPSEPHFIADFYFDLKCVRPMPMYGVPGLIDHF